MATINLSRSAIPLPKVDFTWSPVGLPVSFTFAGNSYPPVGPRFASYYTPVGEVITFTALVLEEAPDVPIVQYRWNMGDGIVKYGETVGHIYAVPNPSISAALEVTDALNRTTYVSHVILLQTQFPTVVSNKVRAGNDPDNTQLLYASTILRANSVLVEGGLAYEGSSELSGSMELSSSTPLFSGGI